MDFQNKLQGHSKRMNSSGTSVTVTEFSYNVINFAGFSVYLPLRCPPRGRSLSVSSVCRGPRRFGFGKSEGRDSRGPNHCPGCEADVASPGPLSWAVQVRSHRVRQEAEAQLQKVPDLLLFKNAHLG